jgi:hypothetical protein
VFINGKITVFEQDNKPDYLGFHLPLSQYKIERVQGDANASKINIWTDENGRVVRGSKEKCSN